MNVENGFEALESKNFAFGSLKTDFEGRLEENFTNSTYMENVWRHNAEFLICTDFRGDFEVQFTDSTYMEFVIWAKKIGTSRKISVVPRFLYQINHF